MKQKFSASGEVDFMDAGNVQEAGNSDRFLVEDRRVEGTVEGDIDGRFSIEFDANLALETQSGHLKGVIYFYDNEENLIYTANMTAKSEGTTDSFEPGVGGMMELGIDGKLKFFGNTKGHADLDGTFDVILDEHGQIAGVADSDVHLDGWLMT